MGINIKMYDRLRALAKMQIDLQQQGGAEKNKELFEQILEMQDKILERFGLPVNHTVYETLLYFATLPTDNEIFYRIKQLQELAVVYLSGDVKQDIQVLKEAQDKQRDAIFVLHELSIPPNVYTLFIYDEILLKGKDTCENVLQELKIVSQSDDILNTLEMLEDGSVENKTEMVENLEKIGLKYIRQFCPSTRKVAFMG